MENNTDTKTSQPSPAIVATDIVLFGIQESQLVYGTIPLSISHFKEGTRGLPGGIILKEETAEESAIRNISQKMNFNESFFCEQLVTMSSLNRDPRSRVVAVAYLGLATKDQITKHPDILWQRFDEKISLGFDHNEILEIAHKRLQDKVEYTTIIQYLLNETFTLSELQETYELILGREIDKRNFRKKIIESDILIENGLEKNVAHRPSLLYSFKSKELQNVSLFFK